LPLHLRTFGAPVLLNDDGEPLLPKGKPLALLAYCAADRRRTLSRDECASLLWSDTPPERARHSVRQVIWKLRRVLGADFGTRDDLITGVGDGLTTDRERFLEAVHTGDADTALVLYAGPFLDGMVLPGGDEFDDWLQFERHRLEEMLVQVVERTAERALEEERRGEARDLVDRLLARAPGHVGARRLLIECALAVGDLATARQVADALAVQATLDGLTLPARVMHAIDRARQSATQPVDSTPVIALDFVGRDGPFADIMHAWQEAQQGQPRRIIVTGVAGIGKSRLLQVVQRRCAGKPARTVLVRANVGEQAVAFGFASLLVRTLGALPGALGVSEATARELVALDPSLTASLRVPPAMWDAVEGPRRRALAVLDLLQAVAEQQPLALLIDDWHWMDAPSRELLTVALGRCEALPLLVVVSSRHAQELPALPQAQTMTLAPLTIDDSVEALRSTGGWPASPAATRFLTLLATASRGVPLDLYERLAMAVDTGQLRWQDGEWFTTDWEILASELAAASPLVQRLTSSAAAERQILLLLAVAGAPVPRDVLEAAVAAVAPAETIPSLAASASQPASAPATSPTSGHDLVSAALPMLESKGLVRFDGEHLLLAHDTIADAVLDLESREHRRAAHGALATAMARALNANANARGARRGASELTLAALRHALQAHEVEQAGTLLARVVASARARGDRRSARAVLHALLGEVPSDVDVRAVLRGVPLWHRWERPSASSLGLGSLMLAVGALIATWRFATAPTVKVMQSPWSISGVPSYGPDVYRLMPAMIVATEEGADSVTVRVRSLDERAEIVAGAELRTPRGTVVLNALRLRLRDSVGLLQVEADGHQPAQVVVRRTINAENLAKRAMTTARLVEGIFGRQHLTPQQPTLRVRPNEVVSGVVQVHYSSILPGASVWVSYTPSWGNPATAGRDIMPVLTPTQSHIEDVQVQFTAPDQVGRHWLIFVVAAEPSGGYALSGTNWTVESALWDDDNDIARLPDSVLVRANRDGFAWLSIAYRDGQYRSRTECAPNPRGRPGMYYCANGVGLFAIPVVVVD